jgi:hypothetical protein
MPRRRDISIEEAYEAFAKQGLRVKVEAIEPEPLPIEEEEAPKPVKVVKTSKQSVITLHAMHTIGTNVYGPGIRCVVPKELEAHLLYQDQLARQADDDFLSKSPRFFLVTQRRTGFGVAHIGKRVGEKKFSTATNLSRDDYDDEFLEIT